MAPGVSLGTLQGHAVLLRLRRAREAWHLALPFQDVRVDPFPVLLGVGQGSANVGQRSLSPGRGDRS